SSDEWAVFSSIAPLVQERTKLLTEVGPQVTFLFVDVLEYDEASWEKVMTKDDVGGVLDDAAQRLEAVAPFETETIEAALRALAEDRGIGAGKAFQPVRVAITGSSISPPLFESLAALGRERSVSRILGARARLGSD
ncbi:MAG: glutamate--tRNA ligase, partial [Acidimicrobiia bacterium]